MGFTPDSVILWKAAGLSHVILLTISNDFSTLWTHGKQDMIYLIAIKCPKQTAWLFVLRSVASKDDVKYFPKRLEMNMVWK